MKQTPTERLKFPFLPLYRRNFWKKIARKISTTEKQKTEGQLKRGKTFVSLIGHEKYSGEGPNHWRTGNSAQNQFRTLEISAQFRTLHTLKLRTIQNSAQSKTPHNL